MNILLLIVCLCVYVCACACACVCVYAAVQLSIQPSAVPVKPTLNQRAGFAIGWLGSAIELLEDEKICKGRDSKRENVFRRGFLGW